eukprot:TRINITY_DN272_c0_g1_i1.p2 TRINITY_DN272_c0_g1~~TRINITY_DN272_c0_g1_i1.p2  ORF type:complete len:109 (+),score=27.69 TRINITY_DN272_c0_g1_i1:70-396(+)
MAAAAEGGCFPSQYDEAGMTSFDRVEADLRGAPLNLVCQMPSGEEHTVSCHMGHDVTYAKALLAKKLQLDYASFRLCLEGKHMFDPLSFFDFPTIDPSKAVRVTVEMV